MVSAHKPISQNAIARELGLSSANMVKMKKKGCPMDSVEAVRAWREERQSVAARKAYPLNSHPPGVPSKNSDVGESFNDARTRRERSDANKSEMEVAELMGVLIRIDSVKASLSVAFSSAREALLQIPARLAPLLAAESDSAAVQNMLHAEIYAALQQLSGASDSVGKTNPDHTE